MTASTDHDIVDVVDDQGVDAAAPAANVTLTDDDQLVDGEVTLPGMYADCVTADGREFTVRITNRERVAWDRASRKHGWGQAEDSPHDALAFVAWQAARNAGDPAGAQTFDQFVAGVPDVEGRQVAKTRPTR